MNSSMPCLRDLTAHFGRPTMFSKVFCRDFFLGGVVVVLGFFLVFYKILPLYFSISIWLWQFEHVHSWAGHEKSHKVSSLLKWKNKLITQLLKKDVQAVIKESLLYYRCGMEYVTLQTEANLQQPHDKSLNTSVRDDRPLVTSAWARFWGTIKTEF